MIRLATIDDYDIVKKLYNKNSKNLGRYFKSDLEERMINNRFYLYFIDDELAGFCSYDIMKRNPSIQINYLCTNEKFRGKHVATDLMSKIIEDTQNLNLYYYIECLEGLDNNTFYDKVGKLYEVVDKGSYKIRKYLIYGKFEEKENLW